MVWSTWFHCFSVFCLLKRCFSGSRLQTSVGKISFALWPLLSLDKALKIAQYCRYIAGIVKPIVVFKYVIVEDFWSLNLWISHVYLPLRNQRSLSGNYIWTFGFCLKLLTFWTGLALDSSWLSGVPLFSLRNIVVERHTIYEQQERSSNTRGQLSRNTLCRAKNGWYCALTVPDLKKYLFNLSSGKWDKLIWVMTTE